MVINEIAERMLEKPRFENRAAIDHDLKNEWIAGRKETLGGQTIRHRRTNYPPIEECIPPVIKQLGQFDLSKYDRSNNEDGFEDYRQNKEQGGYPNELPKYIPVQKNQWSAKKVNSVPYSKNFSSRNQGQKKIYPSVTVSSWTENQVRQHTPQKQALISESED